jgi:hypothetical protein
VEVIFPFWKSNFGKLIIGGCGAQVGMLLAFWGLAVTLFFCGLCLMANALTIGLTGQMAVASSSDLTPAPASSGEVLSLLDEVDALLEVQYLQTAASPVVAGPSSPSGKPIVLAGQSPVGLYSGPDLYYNQVGLLSPGESLEIVGRNIDSTWWFISRPDGLFAWAPAALVTAVNVNETIPVITTPSQLAQPASSISSVAASPTVIPLPTVTPVPTLPPGTPTPAAEVSRQFVEELHTYKLVKGNLLVPPVSASFSPDGSRMAITERIKVYTIGIAGAHTDIWLEDDDKMGPIGWILWSPDGEYLAFVVGFKNPKCRPCETVVLLRVADGTLTFLQAPDNLDIDAPRWTQDGRVLVNVHPGEPADGIAYIYNIYGEGQIAEGVYQLSASHEGQKWFPWRPGRTWRAGVSERPDSYVND